MNIAGKKTKIGAIGCFVSGILFTLSPSLGIPIEMAYGCFSFSIGISIYGFYDRSSKNHQNQVQKLEEIRGRIKKPSIM